MNRLNPYSHSNQIIDVYGFTVQAHDLDTQTLDKLDAMSDIQDLSVRIKNVITKWFCAPGNQLNTTNRTNLYNETKKIVEEVKEFNEANKKDRNIKNSKSLITIINQEFNKHLPNDAMALANWIAQNSSHAEGPSSEKFVGAYEIFNHFFKVINQIEKDCGLDASVEEVAKKKGLAYITKTALTNIKEISKLAPPLIFDINKLIYSGLSSLADLMAVQNTSHPNMQIVDEIVIQKLGSLSNKNILTLITNSEHNKVMLLPELIKRINEGDSLNSFNFDYIEDLINILGDKCNEIKSLNLNQWEIDTDLLELAAEHFVNLSNLILPCIREEILALNHKFNSLQSIQVTVNGVDSFNNILEACPSLTTLKCYCDEIENYDILNMLPHLTEVEFDSCNLQSLKVQNCASLRKISVIACQGFDVNVLEKCRHLTHLSIYSNEEFADINFALPSLTYLYLCDCGFSEVCASEENDLIFLKGSPNLKELIVDELLEEDTLTNFPKLTDLEVLFFNPSSIPALKQSTSLQNLTLKFEHGDELFDICELNEVFVETLTIEGCDTIDFSLLSHHPSLRTLYIKDCSNVETAQMLEEHGIKVIYK